VSPRLFRIASNGAIGSRVILSTVRRRFRGVSTRAIGKLSVLFLLLFSSGFRPSRITKSRLKLRKKRREPLSSRVARYAEIANLAGHRGDSRGGNAIGIFLPIAHQLSFNEFQCDV
jgi:uncharacterized protein (DUF2384 family)